MAQVRRRFVPAVEGIERIDADEIPRAPQRLDRGERCESCAHPDVALHLQIACPGAQHAAQERVNHHGTSRRAACIERRAEHGIDHHDVRAASPATEASSSPTAGELT